MRWAERESEQTASTLWQLYQKKLSIMKRQYYIGRADELRPSGHTNNQQRMSIINFQKFKHRKRVVTETHSLILHTEPNTAQTAQPFQTKKQPYRYLQIDTIKETPSKLPLQNKSLSKRESSSESLRIHKIKSITSIPTTDQYQGRNNLRYSQQKQGEGRQVEENDRSLNNAYIDRQIKRRKVRLGVEKVERESEKADMQMIDVLQEQFYRFRDKMRSVDKGVKDAGKKQDRLVSRNRNASIRIIMRWCARLLERNVSFLFESYSNNDMEG